MGRVRDSARPAQRARGWGGAAPRGVQRTCGAPGALLGPPRLCAWRHVTWNVCVSAWCVPAPWWLWWLQLVPELGGRAQRGAQAGAVHVPALARGARVGAHAARALHALPAAPPGAAAPSCSPSSAPVDRRTGQRATAAEKSNSFPAGGSAPAAQNGTRGVREGWLFDAPTRRRGWPARCACCGAGGAQDTGGFFVAVLEKVAELPDSFKLPMPYRAMANNEQGAPPHLGALQPHPLRVKNDAARQRREGRGGQAHAASRRAAAVAAASVAWPPMRQRCRAGMCMRVVLCSAGATRGQGWRRRRRGARAAQGGLVGPAGGGQEGGGVGAGGGQGGHQRLPSRCGGARIAPSHLPTAHGACSRSAAAAPDVSKEKGRSEQASGGQWAVACCCGVCR